MNRLIFKVKGHLIVGKQKLIIKRCERYRDLYRRAEELGYEHSKQYYKMKVIELNKMFILELGHFLDLLSNYVGYDLI